MKMLCIENDDMSRYDARCDQKGNQIMEKNLNIQLLIKHLYELSMSSIYFVFDFN